MSNEKSRSPYTDIAPALGEFCGNGSDENPEPDVVEKLVKARRPAKPTRPFKLWFNSSSAAAEPKKNKDHE
jgi:hypothetical protein